MSGLVTQEVRGFNCNLSYIVLSTANIQSYRKLFFNKYFDKDKDLNIEQYK